jgi:protein CpxP
MKEMSRLHDDLKLDARQEALWQEAEQFSKHRHARDGRADAPAAGRDAGRRSASRGPTCAPCSQMDDLRDAGRKQREAGRDRWLAVYDSLDASQKEKARLFFKSKLERMGPGGRFGPVGAMYGIRTRDHWNHNPVLYQLS